MHTTPLTTPITTPITLFRSGPARLLDAMHQAIALRLVQWRANAEDRRARRLVATLDERTLRDIGAPEDWIATAAARCARSCMQHINLRRGLVDSQPW